jgi:hypothetical protein
MYRVELRRIKRIIEKESMIALLREEKGISAKVREKHVRENNELVEQEEGEIEESKSSKQVEVESRHKLRHQCKEEGIKGCQRQTED